MPNVQPRIFSARVMIDAIQRGQRIGDGRGSAYYARAMSSVLDQPLTGRQAWTGTDVRERDYRVVLSDRARHELLDAAATLRRQPVPMLALRADSLDLPACRA